MAAAARLSQTNAYYEANHPNFNRWYYASQCINICAEDFSV